MHRVGLVLQQVIGSVSAAGFLVGHGRVDEIALRLEAGSRELANRVGHRRGEVEHVDRAASPDLAVDQLSAERIIAPAVLIYGNDVGVSHQKDGRSVRVGSFDARDEVPASGGRFVALDVDTGSLEEGSEQIDVALFLAGLDRSVVHAAVAD